MIKEFIKKKLNLNVSQLEVYLAVLEADEINIKQLVKKLKKDRTTIQRTLNKLINMVNRWKVKLINGQYVVGRDQKTGFGSMDFVLPLRNAIFKSKKAAQNRADRLNEKVK